MSADQSLPQDMNSIRNGAIGLAVIGALVGAVAFLDSNSNFFLAYLTGFMVWAEVAIGCLGVVMLGNVVDARWLYSIQRIAEAGARTIPVLAIMFIPVALGLGQIYPWMAEGYEFSSSGQEFLLQPLFFIIRTYIYIGAWYILARSLTNWSYQRDADDAPDMGDHPRNYAYVGMVIFVITTSMAAVDWSMSLTPLWFSSVWGLLSLGRAALTTVAVIVIVLALLWNTAPVKDAFNEKARLDLSAIVLVATLVWAYFHVISFVIIWGGNVTYFVSWYDIRQVGGWANITRLMIAGHAVLIFLLLLPGFKRNKPVLLGLAIAILAFRMIGALWVIVPGETGEQAMALWDFGPMVLLGGIWLIVFLRELAAHPLVPVHHPVLAHDDGHGHGAPEPVAAGD